VKADPNPAIPVARVDILCMQDIHDRLRVRRSDAYAGAVSRRVGGRHGRDARGRKLIQKSVWTWCCTSRMSNLDRNDKALFWT
jgi:hypothetical protein